MLKVFYNNYKDHNFLLMRNMWLKTNNYVYVMI